MRLGIACLKLAPKGNIFWGAQQQFMTTLADLGLGCGPELKMNGERIIGASLWHLLRFAVVVGRKERKMKRIQKKRIGVER